MMAEEEKGFVIKDRRTLGKDADEQKKERAAETEPAGEPADQTDEPSDQTATKEQPTSETLLPEVNFPTFIMSLNVSALYHLGAIEDPETKEKKKNLPLAKQTIDILSMLEEKTKGNLTEDEENLLKNMLYDLRIIYVKEKS
jgi:hypothetical protein